MERGAESMRPATRITSAAGVVRSTSTSTEPGSPCCRGMRVGLLESIVNSGSLWTQANLAAGVRISGADVIWALIGVTFRNIS